ncbi:MAG: M3 family oligoendopeptidase [Alphaproteobacteria bacterium]|nr:M3 family oligoendopeptidase [Alphaproteobacteria bacterium]
MNEKAAVGDLPVWNLDDLYAGPDDPALARDLADGLAAAREFRARHAGKLATQDGAALGQAIMDYERLKEQLGRVGSFAGLLHAGNLSEASIGRFYQTMQERLNAITAELLFFTLELNRLDAAALATKLAAPALRRYRPWLDDLRAFRAHELSDDLERLLHEKQVAGRGAWVRLYDETLAALRFPVDGERLTLEEALNRFLDPQEARRKAAAQGLSAVFADNARLLAHVHNTLLKDKEIEDTWRKYPSPAAERHLANQVEPEVVEALRRAVSDAYPRLSHRYYRLKAGWLGKQRLDYWDRNAPLPEDEDRLTPWSEARALVLDAYGRFSPELSAIGKRFFDNAWIDAPVRPGKVGGAFAHPTVPSAHPYLLLNYQGRARDVMTLAHELGHGVHQILAAPQGYLMADTPLTLAETASVFGEQLTFRAMLENERRPARRRALLAGKVEDMLNTVVRQIAFYEFELALHEERRGGELMPERIGQIWLCVQGRSLGPAIHLPAEYAHYWCYIPHFVHTPFYVYAYAFGDCLVNSLYAVCQGAAHGFQAKYLEMLRAGGSKRHKELLAPFGLDASDPGFWRQGLSVLEGFIDQLEGL